MSKTWNRAGRSLLAGAAAVALAGAVAMPAGAAPAKSWIAAPNGMVGVQETITVYAPSLAGQTVTLGLQLGAAASTVQTTIGANGYGSVAWMPQAAGTWTVNGLGSAIVAGSDTFTVAPMPTYTLLLAQNQAAVGVNNNLLAAVVAPIGNLAPSGNVALATANGNGITTQPIGGSFGNSTATATLPWTPTTTGAVPMVASYQPSSGGQLASTSQTSQPNVNYAVQTVAMRWPATLNVGQTTVLQAVLGQNIPDGSVAFLIDGQGLSPSLPTSNGVATFQWTPQSAGVHMITVSYSSPKQPNGQTYSGSSQQQVNIQPALPADNITVDPPTQPAWSIAKPIVMTAGSSVTLAGTATSGTTVLFSEQGNCVISGSQLMALAPGQCQVTAQSPGTATITPGSETYTVTVVAAPKKRAS